MSNSQPTPTDIEGEALFGLANRDQGLLRGATVVWLFAICFLSPLLFLCGSTVRTQSSIPQPVATWPTFLDGSYMQTLETWLREDSPFTYQLRGIWSEVRYSLGVLDSNPVMIGRDDFLFSRGIVGASRGHVMAGKERRAKILGDLRARAQRLGVEVLVVPAPDTVTIYPEKVRLPKDVVDSRAGCYELILDELRAHGFRAIDLRTPFLAFKAHELMYLRRDTHWTDSGARAAALLVATELLSPAYAERIGPEVSLRGDDQMVLVVGDLLAQLGMRSNPGPRRPMAGPLRSVETTVESTLVASLRENHVAWAVTYLGPEIPGKPGAAYEDVMRTGQIALCGDSYSNRSFKWRLALETKRLVDWTHVGEDAIAWQTLRACLDAIEKGECKAKVVVWEFAERKFSQGY